MICLGPTVDNTFNEDTERSLKGNDELLSALANLVSYAVTIINSEGKISLWNRAAEAMFGYSSEEMQGKVLSQHVIAQEFSDAFDTEMVKLLSAGEGASVGDSLEFDGLRKDGSSIPVELLLSTASHEGGQNVICRMREHINSDDIEYEQQMVELQLRQSQKLESIGRLASGIAHEINTPTQFIGDNCHFARDAFDDLKSLIDSYGILVEKASVVDELEQSCLKVSELSEEVDLDFIMEEIPSALTQALEGVSRVTNIVRAMKDFAHPGLIEISEVDVNKAIETTLGVSKNEWKYYADIDQELEPELPPIQCVAEELNQVLLNLIVNAAQAIAEAQERDSSRNDKGRIGITTAHQGNEMQLTVTDNGIGMSPDVVEKAFDPFFTTKPLGKGSGQGLAIIYAIVERHGGSIKIDSTEGIGTTFHLTFPIATEPDTEK